MRLEKLAGKQTTSVLVLAHAKQRDYTLVDSAVRNVMDVMQCDVMCYDVMVWLCCL